MRRALRVVDGDGEGHGGDALPDRDQPRADHARSDRVHPCSRAEVRPGDHQVREIAAHDVHERDGNRVGGRSVDGPHAVGLLVIVDDPGGRAPCPTPATVVERGDDGHEVTGADESVSKRDEPRRLVSIVVREQDSEARAGLGLGGRGRPYEEQSYRQKPAGTSARQAADPPR